MSALHRNTKIFFFVLILICLPLLNCDRQVIAPPESAGASLLRLEGAAMGTSWHITIAQKPGSGLSAEAVKSKVEKRIQEVEGAMSTFIADSEVSRFNARGADEPVKVSGQTVAVVEKALEIARATGGAYDPTVWPLVRLWGFGDKDADDGPPSAEEIEEAAKLVDYTAVNVDRENSTLTKTRAGVSLDLASVAKGYGVDRVWELLDSLGCADFMIEIGGEVRTKGKNPDGVLWRIGIDRPRIDSAPGQELQTVVHLSGRAVATSGDYRNYRTVEGRRISHTIDPRIKGPITHNLASVTVIAPTCIEADALATAADVLGPVEGMKFIESISGVEAMLITREDDARFEVKMTKGFGKYTQGSN